MLNRFWAGLWIVSFVAIGLQLFAGNSAVLGDVVDSLFSMAKLSAEIAIGLVGILTLWMGLMALAEKSGLVQIFAKILEPILAPLMPTIPRGDKAFGSVTMNLMANVFGLDNAATPLGIKAMQDLQVHNPSDVNASPAQMLFLVLNSSSVTLIPITVFLFRAQQGAPNPAEVFVPIVLATCASTLVGLIAVSIVQRINLLQWRLLLPLVGFLSVLALIVVSLANLASEQLQQVSTLTGNGAVLALVFGFILFATVKKLAIYEVFIEGAQGGFKQAITLIPYLVAMLIAIGALRGSGALDYLLDALGFVVLLLGGDLRFIDAMPTALMKPFSGSGARAMMLETMHTYGVDSFQARLAALFQGSTETTLYVIAVYLGAVRLKNAGHALWCGLLADVGGITAAIGLAYWFYG
ncbi:nucleoside recognition domain-containing protein [Paraferrimonas sp. SM1919]|uniref:nucleoside recognition domain-containing protein n=1 Tax=Paraferrimonas sp. SM1919 TaxID=2662263 RepID=UPI0013D87581|nr:nucleoside recognition domain-containing protein [Paraferrimonas sp. SM1919]